MISCGPGGRTFREYMVELKSVLLTWNKSDDIKMMTDRVEPVFAKIEVP